MTLSVEQRERIKSIKSRYDQMEKDKQWYDAFYQKKKDEDILIFTRVRELMQILGWKTQDLADEAMIENRNLRAILNRNVKLGDKRRGRLLAAMDKMERLAEQQQKSNVV